MNENTPKRHDKFYKRVFSHKPTSRAFLEKFLPVEILDVIDLNTLEIESESFVTPELSEYFSDLVLSCSFSKEKQAEIWETVKHFYKQEDIDEGKVGPFRIKISILFEHKSFVPDIPHIQVGKYIFELYDTQKDTQKHLNPIVPVLFFHGKQAWIYRSFYEYFGSSIAGLEGFIPHFNFVLVNMEYISDEVILVLEYALLRNALLAFKHSWDNLFIEENFHLFFQFDSNPELSDEEKQNFSTAVFVYLVKNSKFTEEKVQKIIETLPNPIKNYVMSTYDIITSNAEKRGIIEGKKKGKIEGIIEGKKKGKIEGIIEGKKKGKIEGKKEGKIEGKKEGKIEEQTKMILNGFDKKNMSVRDLSELLEVSEDYVIKILKEYGRIK